MSGFLPSQERREGGGRTGETEAAPRLAPALGSRESGNDDGGGAGSPPLFPL